MSASGGGTDRTATALPVAFGHVGIQLRNGKGTLFGWAVGNFTTTAQVGTLHDSLDNTGPVLGTIGVPANGSAALGLDVGVPFVTGLFLDLSTIGDIAGAVYAGT